MSVWFKYSLIYIYVNIGHLADRFPLPLTCAVCMTTVTGIKAPVKIKDTACWWSK